MTEQNSGHPLVRMLEFCSHELINVLFCEAWKETVPLKIWKQNNRLTFNPGLTLIDLWTTQPYSCMRKSAKIIFRGGRDSRTLIRARFLRDHEAYQASLREPRSRAVELHGGLRVLVARLKLISLRSRLCSSSIWTKTGFNWNHCTDPKVHGRWAAVGRFVNSKELKREEELNTRPCVKCRVSGFRGRFYSARLKVPKLQLCRRWKERACVDCPCSYRTFETVSYIS